MGSPLYAGLLSRSAANAESGGIVSEILRGRQRDPVSSVLALRFMGAVHRMVLEGRAERLARHYPSAGGRPGRGLWRDFTSTLEEHRSELRTGVQRPVQTNEVGRAVALVGGFLTIAERCGSPLRLLELGASAGLNLRWDHFRYVAGPRRGWGPRSSPVRLEAAFVGPVPLRGACEVLERSGCDRDPIDPTSGEGELRLKSYVWADQLDRLHRLGAAIEIARRVPASIEPADAADWLDTRLDRLPRDVTTVVFHTIVWQYLSRTSRDRVRTTLELAGARANKSRPVAWLRLEPGRTGADLRLTIWPDGREELLATSGYHGGPVVWRS
jgi:hypothetical protein